MNEDEASQRLAQVARTLRLINFKLMQLRHTNDQLLAGLQDLLGQAHLCALSRPTPDADASLRNFRKDSPS